MLDEAMARDKTVSVGFERSGIGFQFTTQQGFTYRVKRLTRRWHRSDDRSKSRPRLRFLDRDPITGMNSQGLAARREYLRSESACARVDPTDRWRLLCHAPKIGRAEAEGKETTRVLLDERSSARRRAKLCDTVGRMEKV